MNKEPDVSENPSMIDVRKCLKEAGFLDPTLSENEMLEIYNVLKHSQNTATEEDQHRRILEQTETNCSMIEELRRNSVPVFTAKANLDLEEKDASANYGDVSSSSSSNDLSEEATKICSAKKPFTPKMWKGKTPAKPLSDIEEQITANEIHRNNSLPHETCEPEENDQVDVFDSIPTLHKPLKQISINAKYSPPFYCNPKVKSSEYRERALTISVYHISLLRKYNNYQQLSLFPAPWEKTIQSNLRFNGNLLRKIDKSIEDDTENDDKLLESLKEEKNSDDEFELYTSKSGRQTKRKLYTEKDGDDSNSSDWKKKSKTTTVTSNQDTKKTPTRKRQPATQLSNEDIMKRSKLFDNSPSTRTSKLFDKLIDDSRKKHEEEKKIDKFTTTLNNVSDDDHYEEPTCDVAELVHSEEPFVRRRVVPPTYTKKSGGSGRGRGRSKKTANKKSSEESSSQESQKYNPLDFAVPLGNAGSGKEKGRCPICNEEFFQSELLEHASTCGDSNSPPSTVSIRRPSFGVTRITCEKCDQVLPLDTNYEVHVKACLANAMN